MAADIDVRETDPGRFVVTVREGGSETVHHVSAAAADVRRIGGGAVSGVELVRRSFEFLLEREPKEAILRRFDLPVIGRYFADYERELRSRLGS
jgi:hypothetical protein